VILNVYEKVGLGCRLLAYMQDVFNPQHQKGKDKKRKRKHKVKGSERHTLVGVLITKNGFVLLCL
jgi:hypothetical protein